MFEVITNHDMHLVAEEEPQPAPSPTVTYYQQLAAQLNALLETVRAGVPTLETVTPEAKAFIRRKRGVEQSFIAAAVGSLTLAEDLQGLGDLSTEETTDDAQFIDGLTPLMMNAVLLAQQLQLTIRARRARLATKAQKIYAFARAQALDRDAAKILPHLENMKRARKRRATASNATSADTPLPATLQERGASEGGA